jgi:hypothetical protein
MRITILAVAAVTAAAAAGCGSVQTPSIPDESAFDRRAAQIAPLWHGKTGGFTPVQDLTIAPKDGFPDDKTKEAFGAGWYALRVPLEEKPGKGAIEYPDGSKTEIDVLSAATAFQAMDQGDAGCPECATLEVTAAQLGKAPLRTSRGVATVPVWLFTVTGLSAPVGRVAVPPGSITPLPTPSVPAWDNREPLAAAQDLVSVDEGRIDFRLGVGACDKGIKGLVWEDPEVVVIGGSVTPPGPAEICTDQLLLHPVTVMTSAPIGDRLIIDALTGVPVTLR